jgi:7-carboxy-7-deazaguanine synthase
MNSDAAQRHTDATTPFNGANDEWHQYAINDVYNTIQGEGRWTGTPMTLIRLQGCAVGCPFCDTSETWMRDEDARVLTLTQAFGENARWCRLDGRDVASYVSARFAGPKWCMITGGEPAQQPLSQMVVALHDVGRRVMVETSGTAAGHMDTGIDWTCVSPKYRMPGKRPLIRRVMETADELKFVIGRERDIAIMDDVIDQYNIRYDTVMSVQPMSQSKKATKLCMDLATNRGWQLSIQMHKYIDQR